MVDDQDKVNAVTAEVVRQPRSNAEIAVAIEERLATTHHGQELAGDGVTTVALDEDGDLIECRPDGSCRPLPSSR